MKQTILVALSLYCLTVPALALAAGNPNPRLYLEIYNFGAEEPGTLPEYICLCPGEPLHAEDVKTTGMSFGYLAVHIGNVPNGYYGLQFGVESIGGSVTFLEALACPGFLKVPSTAGEPDAIGVASIVGCRSSSEHLCYLRYATSDLTPTYFRIVASADMGHYMVINCDIMYDEGTQIGGGAKWGEEPVCIEKTVWGRLKTLYR
ncbi:MAG: hypothetical protein AMJ46_10785 [Latescibacteria bacterium DG_63]|nr:MAG: hypothetical protein AMJ46_10785 [Latescibacteria bacterium DG_63]